jgi:hypothetical protein
MVYVTPVLISLSESPLGSSNGDSNTIDAQVQRQITT